MRVHDGAQRGGREGGPAQAAVCVRHVCMRVACGGCVCVRVVPLGLAGVAGVSAWSAHWPLGPHQALGPPFSLLAPVGPLAACFGAQPTDMRGGGDRWTHAARSRSLGGSLQLHQHGGVCTRQRALWRRVRSSKAQGPRVGRGSWGLWPGPNGHLSPIHMILRLLCQLPSLCLLWPWRCGSMGHSPGALTGGAWDRWALLVVTGPGTS